MKFNLCSFFLLLSNCGLLFPLNTTSLSLVVVHWHKIQFPFFSMGLHRFSSSLSPFDFSSIHFSNSSSSCLDQLRRPDHNVQGPIQMLDTSYMKWMRRASHVSHSASHTLVVPCRLNNRSWRLLGKQKLLRFSIKVFPVTEYRIATHTFFSFFSSSLHKKNTNVFSLDFILFTSISWAAASSQKFFSFFLAGMTDDHFGDSILVDLKDRAAPDSRAVCVILWAVCRCFNGLISFD